MRDLLARYDAYLRRKAETTPASDRATVSRGLVLYWTTPLILWVGAVEVLHLPTPKWTLMPPFLIFLIGGIHAAARFIHHGSNHDKTPRVGFSSPAERLLVEHLRLICLMPLTELNRETEVYYDLRLSGFDLAVFLRDLAKACGVEALPLPPGPFAPEGHADWRDDLRAPRRSYRYRSLTVGMVLDAMVEARPGIAA